jgi:hypothetical protein
MDEASMSNLSNTELREQLEEFALHMKPGTTKGKHRTAIYDTLELSELVQRLIEQAQHQLLREILEQSKVLKEYKPNDNGDWITSAVPVEVLKAYMKEGE